MLAYILPNDRWLVLLHVGSAFLLVAGLIVVVVVSLAARRRASSDQVPLLRAIAFRTNLAVVVPAFVAVHVFGGILSDREYKGHEPNWLSLGFSITSVSTIVAVLLVFVQFWVLRRVRTGRLAGWPAELAAWIPVALLLAMVAVVVLMAGKPAG